MPRSSDQQRVLTLGFPPLRQIGWLNGALFDRWTTSEYDVAIVDPHLIVGPAANVLNTRELDAWEAKIARQREQFISFIDDHNGSLIIVLRTRDVEDIVMYPHPLPIGLTVFEDIIKPRPNRGDSIEAAGPLQNLLMPFANCLRRSALPGISPKPEMIPLFQVCRTKEVAGGAFPFMGGGILAFVPSFSPPFLERSTLDDYLAAMVAMPAALRASLEQAIGTAQAPPAIVAQIDEATAGLAGDVPPDVENVR